MRRTCRPGRPGPGRRATQVPLAGGPSPLRPAGLPVGDFHPRWNLLRHLGCATLAGICAPLCALARRPWPVFCLRHACQRGGPVPGPTAAAGPEQSISDFSSQGCVASLIGVADWCLSPWLRITVAYWDMIHSHNTTFCGFDASCHQQWLEHVRNSSLYDSNLQLPAIRNRCQQLTTENSAQARSHLSSRSVK